jgi:hypothetical protein
MLNNIRNEGIFNYNSFYHQKEARERYINEVMFLFYVRKNEKKIFMPKDFHDYSSEYLQNVYKIKHYNKEIIYLDSQEEAYKYYLQQGGRIISNIEINLNNYNNI